SRSTIGTRWSPSSAAASMASSAGRSGVASPSIQSTSRRVGSQPRSYFIGALPSPPASDEQSGAEVQAGGQDRPGRDRPDVDVEEARRRFQRARAARLRRRPGDDEREDQPDDQPQPDEERPGAGEDRERPAAAG